MQFDSRFLSVLLDEDVEQTIAPRARRLTEVRFDALHVDFGDRARRDADDEEPARERRRRDRVVDLRLGAAKRLLENLPRALLEVGRVAVARNVDVAGDESLEQIAAHEERHALPLLQLQDAPRDVKEIVVSDLEDLVAREGLEIGRASCRG